MSKVIAQISGINALAGMIVPFAGPAGNIPAGWLNCDGSQVARATYAALFAAIGTSWGNGDGATTFHLPDLRGRFLRGLDAAAGNDPDRAARTAANAGGNTGDTVGSVQADDYKTHGHIQVVGLSAGGSATMQASSASNLVGSFGNGSVPTANSGGSTETRPKNANVIFIIKT